jgi:hypothetical protein
MRYEAVSARTETFLKPTMLSICVTDVKILLSHSRLGCEKIYLHAP